MVEQHPHRDRVAAPSRDRAGHPVTKTFTAAAVLRQAEAGTLGLDAPVSR
ncbi:serine hydrolase [Streptomyces albogriseolus]